MEKITIRAARVNAGMTQTQVAAVCNVNPATVSRWESGKAFPNGLELMGLAYLYGVKVDDFIVPKPTALS